MVYDEPLKDFNLEETDEPEIEKAATKFDESKP